RGSCLFVSPILPEAKRRVGRPRPRRPASLPAPDATPAPKHRGRAAPNSHTAHSNIPSYSITILRIFLAVLFPQEFFFAQYLPVDQPNAGNEVDQHNPIGEHQYLSEQHAAKCDIKWIPAERKYARSYELVGLIDVDADAKPLAKGN